MMRFTAFLSVLLTLCLAGGALEAQEDTSPLSALSKKERAQVQQIIRDWQQQYEATRQLPLLTEARLISPQKTGVVRPIVHERTIRYAATPEGKLFYDAIHSRTPLVREQYSFSCDWWYISRINEETGENQFSKYHPVHAKGNPLSFPHETNIGYAMAAHRLIANPFAYGKYIPAEYGKKVQKIETLPSSIVRLSLKHHFNDGMHVPTSVEFARRDKKWVPVRFLCEVRYQGTDIRYETVFEKWQPFGECHLPTRFRYTHQMTLPDEPPSESVTFGEVSYKRLTDDRLFDLEPQPGQDVVFVDKDTRIIEIEPMENP
ncbi:MAG: hypothetical protein OHK0029_38560 [Armatimonadaceae bacterium]